SFQSRRPIFNRRQDTILPYNRQLNWRLGGLRPSSRSGGSRLRSPAVNPISSLRLKRRCAYSPSRINSEAEARNASGSLGPKIGSFQSRRPIFNRRQDTILPYNRQLTWRLGGLRPSSRSGGSRLRSPAVNPISSLRLKRRCAYSPSRINSEAEARNASGSLGP